MPIKFLNDVAVDSSVLYVDTINNRVGVGTSSPDETFTLQTQATGLGNEGIFIKNPFAGTTPIVNSKSPFLSLATATTSAYNSTIYMGRNATATNQESKIEWSNANNGLSIYVAGQGSYREHVRFGDLSNSTARTFFNGNVGIGTTSPASILHVEGGSPTTNIIASSGNGFLRIADSATSATRKEFTILLDNANNRVDMQAIQQGVAARNITLNASGGNVGIGTTSPGAKLEVNGNIAINAGQKIQLSGSADSTHHIYHDATTDYDKINYSSGFQLEHHSSGIQMTLVGSSGNVGIGTTSPSYKLEVNGNAQFEDYIRITNSSGSQHILFGNQDSSGANNPSVILGANGNTYIGGGNSWNTNGGTLDYTATFLDNGNVGIGTTSPSAKLHIEGDGSIIRLQNNSSDANGTFIDFRDSTGARTGYVGTTGTSDDMFLFTQGAKPIRFYTNASERMHINSSGNVGIGTTSPSYPLDVNGIGRFFGTLMVDTTTDTALVLNSTDNGPVYMAYKRNGDRHAYVGFGGSSDQFYITNEETTGSLFFNTVGGGIYVNSNGNVGVGTTSPGSKLEVSGGDIRLSTNATYLRSKDSASAIPRVLGMNASNAFYIGPIDSYAGGGIIYGASSNVSYHGFYGGGSEKVRITSAGNVGIGTTSPSNKLHVHDSSAAYKGITLSGNAAPSIVFDSTNSVVDWKIGNSGTNANNFAISTSATSANESVVVTSDGNVGIGITAPVSKLHVYNNDGQTSTAAGITVEQDGTGDAIVQYLLTAVKRWTTGVDNSDGDKFKISQSADLATDNVMTLTTTGNVGIGTTSPSSKLTVVDDILLTGSSPSLTLTDATSSFVVKTNTAGEGILQTSGTSKPIRFFRNNGSNESMRINGNGNVGIGTTNPLYQLQLSINSAAKPTSSTWTVVSDERVKTNIRPYETGLQELLQIEPKLFDYNGKAGFDAKTKNNIGVIAQEIKEVMPETVKKYNAKLNEEDEEDTELYNFDGHALTFALINSVKELNAKIKSLETKIQTLENQ